MKKLPVLCPQEYEGTTMVVVPCTRCNHWIRDLLRCSVPTGCEHLPLVAVHEVPRCPVEDRCQHQIQAGSEPCVVRARGMLCASVVGEDHPLAFDATTVASPEEWAERSLDEQEDSRAS